MYHNTIHQCSQTPDNIYSLKYASLSCDFWTLWRLHSNGIVPYGREKAVERLLFFFLTYFKGVDTQQHFSLCSFKAVIFHHYMMVLLMSFIICIFPKI